MVSKQERPPKPQFAVAAVGKDEVASSNLASSSRKVPKSPNFGTFSLLLRSFCGAWSEATPHLRTFCIQVAYNVNGK